jgi:hypothetical protein
MYGSCRRRRRGSSAAGPLRDVSAGGDLAGLFGRRLIESETGFDLDGYVWGVKWHCLYPGAKLLPESETTCRWSNVLGIDFHEVRIETNAHILTLHFSDLQVSEIPARYARFVTSSAPTSTRPAPAPNRHQPSPPKG